MNLNFEFDLFIRLTKRHLLVPLLATIMINNIQNSVLFMGAVGALFLMGGCKSIGPESVKEVHQKYNDAIAKTNDEQTLFNIVRLKYLENPCFMDITGIAESRKFTTRVGPSGSRFGLVNNSGNYELGLVAYSEIFQNPTVTYSPLKGEDFTKRMLSPLPVAVVLGLIQAGWNVKRVFNLCVECINHLDNASTASGPTPVQEPEYESFSEAIDLMDALYSQKRLVIGLNPDGPKDLVLRFVGSDSQSQQLKSILGLDPNSFEFRFNSNFLDTRSTNLTVRTRSVMEVFFYLSHAVNVPQKDIDAGLVTITKGCNGKIFDWTQCLSGKWITINCTESRERPKDAFVSIFYRGKWFYIADNDLNSKSTFMFLNYLFNLQSGNSMASVPTLTISAN
ncbi:MAG: hypothetical protein LBB05_02975 [Puniceicoccales bacterium]|jgi:hypothetical protein|nr:hypothetical protein [Puniceicoccales bacterium]